MDAVKAPVEPARTLGGTFVAGDALRAVSSLMIIVFHFAYVAIGATGHEWFADAYGTYVGKFLASFQVSIQIFFGLSGYLIAGPFVRAYVTGRPMPDLRRFARVRALRIVPAFWVVATVYLLLHGTYGASASEIVAIYGFAQNYHQSTAALLVGQAWTLDVEVLFYVSVPLIAVAVNRSAAGRIATPPGRAVLVAMAATVLWLGSLLFRELAPGSGEWQRSFPGILFAFLPGVVLAGLEQHLVLAQRLAPAPRRIAAALVIGGTALFAVFMVRVTPGTPPIAGFVPGALASLAATGFLAAPMVLQWGGVRTPRVLDNRVMHWTGERSYGIYLIHQGLLVSIPNWFDYSTSARTHLLQTLLVGLPICFVAAAALFTFVERPAMRWARRPRRQAHAPVAAAA